MPAKKKTVEVEIAQLRWLWADSVKNLLMNQNNHEEAHEWGKMSRDLAKLIRGESLSA